MTNNLLKKQLSQLPASPGVYLMRDTGGTILYVGKASNLRQRVRSYFRQNQPVKTRQLVTKVNDIDYFVTGSEQEALILELNLIKRHRPRYNVRLKDDKTFPYLKISINEDWPRIYTTRRLEENGGRYFGPFASARSVRHTLQVIKEIFPFRACSKAITQTDTRPCLKYHIGRCPGPCTGAISKEEYTEIIKQVILFLEGKQEKVIQQLERKMNQAAAALEFEKAALLRDRIQAVGKIIEGQKIAAIVKGEQDAIAFTTDNNRACAQVFFIRGSKLIGRESFALEGTRSEEPARIMTNFVKQFYNSSTEIPPLLLLQYPLEDKKVISDWLASKAGHKVRIQVPSRGSKKRLIDIVAQNARQGLEQLKLQQLASPKALSAALAEIQQTLNLPDIPARIEGYDISNLQGKEAVGSMVVFEQGKPRPAQYRRFKIKTVPSANDYAMLQEVLKRRLKRSGASQETWALPDLILIDGGKGQLRAAQTVIQEAMAKPIPIASLAKENEEIFIPGQPAPLVLPQSSPALQLLQRLRDEAHRFALSYHHKIHRKGTFASALDAIPGIGPKRKSALLKQFGSVPAIREATIEELSKTKGMNTNLAKIIKEHL